MMERKPKKPWPAWVYNAIDRAMPDRILDTTHKVRMDVSDWKRRIAAELTKTLRRRGLV